MLLLYIKFCMYIYIYVGYSFILDKLPIFLKNCGNFQMRININPWSATCILPTVFSFCTQKHLGLYGQICSLCRSMEFLHICIKVVSISKIKYIFLCILFFCYLIILNLRSFICYWYVVIWRFMIV